MHVSPNPAVKRPLFILNHSHISNMRHPQQGIVIVDGPVVGESSIMDDMVKEYLPEAFAFIYVINSARGGGIEEHRVG